MAKPTQRLAGYKTAIYVLVVALLLFALGVCYFGWAGTGFPGKTLWDWLELAIIPVVIAIVAFLLNQAQHRNDLAIENLRDQERVLQSYIERMTKLMLEHGLGKLKPGHEIEQYLDQMTKLLFEGELDQSREASLRDELWSGLSGKLSI